MAVPSKNFSIIPDSDVDPDSRVDTSLMVRLRDNDIHLEEWLGLSYTAAQDHDHDGVNSKAVTLAADHQQFVVAAGAGWSVSTGALAFTPYACVIHWAYAQIDTVAGWGVAMGTGAGDQNGISLVWDIGAVGEPMYAFTIDANDIMGYENTAGGTGNFTTAFDERARVTNFDATGVTITTQTGTWGGSNLYINMLVWGA